MKRLVTPRSVLLCFLLASSAALAHGDEPHGKAPHAPKTAPVPATAAAPIDEDHRKEHPQPHGGQVFVVDTADHLHAEVVFDDAGVHLWFYDDQMKPLAPPPAAKATLVVGKEVRKLDLKPMATFNDKPDAHVGAAAVIPHDSKVALVVQATVNGKPRSGRVERNPSAATSTSTPTTPAVAPPITH